MGAYTEGRNNPLFAIPSQSSSTPHLADAISEVESFLSLARHIEASLTHEKSISKKLRDELQLLELTHSKLKQQHEIKSEEFKNREKQLNEQVKTFIQSALSSEKSISKKLREDMISIGTRYNQLREYCEKQAKHYKKREAQLSKQVSVLKEDNDRIRSENSQLYELLDQLKEEKRKLSIQNEIQAATLSQKKNLEDTLKQQTSLLKSELLNYQGYIQKLRKREQSFRSHIASLNQNLTQSKNEQNAFLISSSSELQRKLAEATELLEQEKRKCTHLEDLFIKERREKQLALTHLHSAEARLSLVSKEVDELKEREFQNSKSSTIKMQF